MTFLFWCGNPCNYVGICYFQSGMLLDTAQFRNSISTAVANYFRMSCSNIHLPSGAFCKEESIVLKCIESWFTFKYDSKQRFNLQILYHLKSLLLEDHLFPKSSLNRRHSVELIPSLMLPADLWDPCLDSFFTSKFWDRNSLAAFSTDWTNFTNWLVTKCILKIAFCTLFIIGKKKRKKKQVPLYMNTPFSNFTTPKLPDCFWWMYEEQNLQSFEAALQVDGDANRGSFFFAVSWPIGIQFITPISTINSLPLHKISDKQPLFLLLVSKL